MLMRFDPFRELDRSSQPGSLDRGAHAGHAEWTPTARVTTSLSISTCRVWSADSIDLTVEKNVLTVSAGATVAAR